MARRDQNLMLISFVILPFDGSPIAMMSAMLASAYRVMPTPFAVEFHPRRPLVKGTQPDEVVRDAMDRGIIMYEHAA